MKMHDREVVALIKGGSNMRNLNDEQSDVDNKIFVLPTFNDLYESKVYSKQTTSDEVDNDVQDVRRLETLLYKANPAYLDLLFSPEIQTFGYEKIDEIIAMRDDIANMNLSNLYSATMGTVQRNINDLQNPTSEKVTKLIERHAYNPKKAMLVVHLCKVLIKFHANNFTDYKSAIWYEGKEREQMMRLKRGELSFDAVKAIIRIYETEAIELKEVYKSQELRVDVNKRLQIKLRDLIFDAIQREVIV